MRYISGLVLLSTVVGQARAEWVQVARANTGAVWSMDAGRIRKSGGKTQGWVQIDFSADRSVRYRRAVQLVSFDCQASTYRTLSFVNYDSYGKVVGSRSYSDYGYGVGYDPVVPDSMAEAAFDVACASGSSGE